MIYLDYQATTPLAPEARAAMLPWLRERFGNPHATHRLGREAAATVEMARAQVATLLGDAAGRGETVFTSGATEAANWALTGALLRDPGRRRIVALATEHACVLDTGDWLERQGAELEIARVDADGLVDLDDLASLVDDRTALVAAMLVNNEIGVIQPVAEIAAIAHAAGALFFCDAVQGAGRVPLPLGACDMVAVSAHKLHGPGGIGALWLRDGLRLPPLIHGGGQQGGLRSGTVPPVLCAGFGAAAAVMVERAGEDAAHVMALADRARAAFGPDWTLNGSADARYRGNLSLRREGLDVARLVSEERGVAFSAGSACASGSGRPSHVLEALGLSGPEARGTIRLGFGRYTTADEIDEAARLLNAAAARQLEWA